MRVAAADGDGRFEGRSVPTAFEVRLSRNRGEGLGCWKVRFSAGGRKPPVKGPNEVAEKTVCRLCAAGESEKGVCP